jgi:hypothetical protein
MGINSYLAVWPVAAGQASGVATGCDDRIRRASLHAGLRRVGLQQALTGDAPVLSR